MRFEPPHLVVAPLLLVLAASSSMASYGPRDRVTDVGPVAWAAGEGARQSIGPATKTASSSPFSYGVQFGITNGYDRWGGFVGPMVEYSPLPWLGVRASACYENDIYLFFQHYRVNGVVLNADVCFKWGRFSASLGPNMDYYIAPVAERRLHGWHANLGATATPCLGVTYSLEAGYVNRVDPYMLGYAKRGWSSVSPLHVLLQDVPQIRIVLSLALHRRP